MGRASKRETERRVNFAASLLAQGHSSSAAVTQVADLEGLSRRQSRRIVSAAHDLIVQDLEEMDISRPQMVAQLIGNLQAGVQKGLVLGQIGAVASCTKTLIELCGLAADSDYNVRKRKNHL